MPGAERPPALTTDLLSHGVIALRGLIPWASNDTYLAEVSDGEGRALAVYKPRDGEAPLWDFPPGTLYAREIAAHVVSEGLGWGLVPPTVRRDDGPLGAGSLQLFVEHDPEQHYLTLGAAHPDVFRRVAALDVVINNADRKSGHCLLERGTGRIWVVDHGVCFHPDPKLRTVIWDFAGEPVPPGILEDVRAWLGREPEAGLLRLLTADEVEATLRRAERLLDHPVYPSPGSHRSYPWPPV